MKLSLSYLYELEVPGYLVLFKRTPCVKLFTLQKLHNVRNLRNSSDYTRLIKSDEMGFFAYTFSLIMIYFTKYPYSSQILFSLLLSHQTYRLCHWLCKKSFIAHLYNSTLILQPSATNRNCPILDLKTRLMTPVEFPADVRQVNSKRVWKILFILGWAS